MLSAFGGQTQSGQPEGNTAKLLEINRIRDVNSPVRCAVLRQLKADRNVEAYRLRRARNRSRSFIGRDRSDEGVRNDVQITGERSVRSEWHVNNIAWFEQDIRRLAVNDLPQIDNGDPGFSQ